jgi:imidazolonepropionase-like amidohydrolase
MSPRMMFHAAALLAAATAFPALAQDMAITNARVIVGDGGAPIEQGTVLVRAGKVIAAGAGVIVPAGVRTIDAHGGWVTPGLFVAVTNLGLFDVGDVDESNDETATAQFNAALDVGPAINPLSQQIAVGRAGGITRAAIAPTGTTAIFAGQGAVIDLGVDGSPVTRARAFQYIELGETGARLAGGSRVAAHAALRNALAEAQGFATRGDDVLLTRADAAALVPVVTGKQLLLIHVERAQDIRMVLALRVEFPALKLVIVGASEGWLVAKELAASGVPVIANPLNDLPAQFETLAATQSNVGRMTAAGVKVAIGNLFNNDQPRWAPQYAGNLVALNKVPGAKGLSWGQAFATISSIPAEILGLGDSLGSLKPGRAGDVVIWDGDPLEVTSGVVAVYIDGVEQPLSNHQTRLRDRYRSPTEGSLPKAYDW